MAVATQPAAKRPEYPVRRPLKRPAVHPGVLMREILEDHLKVTIAEAARRMGVSRPALYAVLNGTAAVTAEMALRFARLTGGAPELYLNMQTSYDLEAARRLLNQQPQPLSDEGGSRRSVGPANAQPDLDEPPNTKRWVLRRKAVIIAAVRTGGISLDEALRRYQLSVAEYHAWEQAIRDQVGKGGLAVFLAPPSRPEDQAAAGAKRRVRLKRQGGRKARDLTG